MASKIRIRLAPLVAACVILTAPAFAETREECEMKIPRQTTMAAAAGAGTLTGAAIGAKACVGWLGLFFVDYGLSYATCVGAVTLLGTVVGTAAGESANIDNLDQCMKLAENKLSPSAEGKR